MYRCGILLKNGKNIVENFSTKDECDTWIIQEMDKEDIKKFVIVNQDNPMERYAENF